MNGTVGEKLLSLTSLENWNWGETAIVAVIVLIGVLTVRAVIERDQAIYVGKDDKSRREAYEARWRTGSTSGA